MIQDVPEPAVANFVQKSFEIISVIDLLIFRTKRIGALSHGYPQERSSLSKTRNCSSRSYYHAISDIETLIASSDR